MKSYSCLLLMFIFCFLKMSAQDTTNVLFIGNSFIAANNLTQLFQSLALADNVPVYTGEWAPGGISVGDSADGTNAHSNNPVVFNLIKSRKWDYVVLQDKQGRFFHNYGVFIPTSNVIGGHLKIMDSVMANNQCARMIWFAGWAYQGYYPVTGATDVQLIDSIYANYTFLNDTAHQIIAPIGAAWLEAMANYPGVDLWAADSAHPSLAGSYLTACVIYASIFKKDPANIAFDGGLISADAQYYRSIAYPKVVDSLYSTGLSNFTPSLSIHYDTLLTDTGYFSYNWFKKDVFLSSTNMNSYVINSNDTFRVACVDANGCEWKSLILPAVITSASTSDLKIGDKRQIFPNPASGNVYLKSGAGTGNVKLYLQNIDGRLLREFKLFTIADETLTIPLNGLDDGIYFLEVVSKNGPEMFTIVVNNNK